MMKTKNVGSALIAGATLITWGLPSPIADRLLLELQVSPEFRALWHSAPVEKSVSTLV